MSTRTGFTRGGYQFKGYETIKLRKLHARKDRLYAWTDTGTDNIGTLVKADQWSRVILKLNRAIKREQTICGRIDRIYNWLSLPINTIEATEYRRRTIAAGLNIYLPLRSSRYRVTRALKLLRKLKGWSK